MTGSRRKLAAGLVAIGAIAAAGFGGCGGSGTPSAGGGQGGTTARATTPGSSASPSQSARSADRGGRRVAVIVMENHEYGDVIGSAAAPFINGLARRYALARSMYAVTHPSLPNYLALTGGSTFGISSDCTTCSVHATSIVDQLERAGIAWKAYMEDLPHPCFTGASAGDYAKKHDPFVYYNRVVSNPAWCARVVPLTELSADERAGTMPRFVWITPNLCHDMHDCSVSTGDHFLSTLVPPLLRSLGPHGVLFITWDEGTTDAGCCGLASGGHIATIVAGQGARAGGAEIAASVDHYSLLATVEGVLGLPRLRGAACSCTPSLQSLLVSRPAAPQGP